MATEADMGEPDAADSAIRRLLDERAAAVRTGDLDRLLAMVAADAVLYDALSPVQRTGRAVIRAKTNEWFSGYIGSIGYETQDLHIDTGEDVAVCHYLSRITGTMTGGQRVDMRLRTTLGLVRHYGTWMIAHEHTSVPFDAESGRAQLDLTL